jgi:DMSO reductase family type II enzyme heme b subunit
VGVFVKANYASGAKLEQLLNVEDGVWASAGVTSLALHGTPAGMQPTAAIRNTWEKKPIGATSKVEVRALHNGEVLAFHLSWSDANHDVDHGDNSRWPDAAAIALPLHESAPLMTMGAPGAPLTAWYWRADAGAAGFQVVAQGPGSTQIVDKQQVKTAAKWQNGKWQIVIARSLKGADSPNIIQLAAGQATRFGVAIWEGSHQERGGLKSFSGDWQALELAGAQ